MLHHRRTVASAVAREDELVSLAQAETALLQLPLHFAEHHILLGRRRVLISTPSLCEPLYSCYRFAMMKPTSPDIVAAALY